MRKEVANESDFVSIAHRIKRGNMSESAKKQKGFNFENVKSETTRTTFLFGGISLVIAIVTFWLAIILFPYSTLLPNASGSGQNAKQIDWNLLGAFTSLTTMSFIVGGLIFAFIENIQIAIQRKRESAEAAFNIYKDIFDRLMNPGAQAARRWIILNLDPINDFPGDETQWLECTTKKLNDIPPGWKGDRPPGREYLKEVLNTFDFIGFVEKHYWSMDTELVSWMSPSIAKVWERIGFFVEDEARRRNEPDYYESARNFGRNCLDWRRDHYQKSNIVDDAT
jgi:hypothetical protein